MRIVAIAIGLAVVTSPAAAQRTIDVSTNGAFRTLAAAVGAAHPGDRVVIHDGIYRGPTAVVDKRLTIEAQGRPVLDGENTHGLIVVKADDVTVRGLTLRNVGTSFVEDRAALRVDNAKGCLIDDNRIEDGFFGIYLANVTDCRVTHNTLRATGQRETESGNGIHLWTSRRITIAGNTITGHRDGIYFEFVHESDIRDNLSTENLRYGMHFMYSDDCRYTNNIFRKNGSGVAVMFTKRVEMVGNRFEDNWGPAAYGLLLKEISDSRLERNVFSRNTVALVADGANRLQAIDNDFINNGWAVKLEASTDEALFSRNNFTGNTFDVATNSSRQSAVFAGNYWQDYTGYDLNRDGVGDVPFRPVRLFSMVVAQNAPSIILLRSPFVRLLDTAERVFPALTPEMLADASPAMRRIRW